MAARHGTGHPAPAGDRQLPGLWFGSMPVAEVRSQHMLEAIRKVEEGAHEIAPRLVANCSRILKYAAQSIETTCEPANV